MRSSGNRERDLRRLKHQLFKLNLTGLKAARSSSIHFYSQTKRKKKREELKLFLLSVSEGDKLTVRYTDVGEGWLQCEDANGTLIKANFNHLIKGTLLLGFCK